jgi:GDPmannose 4,6-dehydratase
LGNLDARRDWGHAQDYVRAMYLIMSAPTPDDYVVSTGETHSVREFVETGWKLLDGASNGIIWSGTGQNEIGTVRTSNGLLVKVNPNFYRPAEVDLLIGDSTKIRTQLGWKPEFTFKTLIEDMLWFDLRNHP